MYAYLVRRVLATIPVMGVVAIFVFLLLHLTPGDPAAVIAGDYASPADIERIRERLGLNDPLYIQFGRWIAHLAQGDLGISIFSNLPVSQLVAQRLERIAREVATSYLCHGGPDHLFREPSSQPPRAAPHQIPRPRKPR